MNALSFPFLLTMVALAAALLALTPPNLRALRAVMRPGGALGDGPPRRRARWAWLVSVMAVFAGPAAPLLGVAAVALGLWARRTVLRSELRDPLDLACATAAALNGAFLIVMGAVVMLSVWMSSFN